MGAAGNYIFVLIMGYFSFDETRTIKVKEKLLKLLGQMVFTACCTTVISLVYYKLNRGKGIFIQMFSINSFNTAWWFVGWYLLILIITSFFLNSKLINMEKEKLQILILSGFMLVSVKWSGKLLDSIGDGLRILLAGLLFYVLGGYIHKYGMLKTLKTRTLLLMMLVLYGFVFLSYYNVTKNNCQQYILEGKSGVFLQEMTAYKQYNAVPMALAVILFLITLRTHITYSRYVNFLASSTFMVYMFHETTFIRSVYKGIDWITMLEVDLLGFVAGLIYYALILFLAGIGLFIVYCVVKRVVVLYRISE